jgi:hypothetical protein
MFKLNLNDENEQLRACLAMIVTSPRVPAFVAILAIVAVLSGCSRFPPIAAGLSRNFAEGSKEFDRRIHERFPVGSPSANLDSELQRQGFERQLPEYPTDQDLFNKLQREGFKNMPNLAADKVRHWLRIEMSGFPCGAVLQVLWTQDAAGDITAINGSYFDSGCP